MTDTLSSYQSMYASLSAEITSNICKIENLSKDDNSESKEHATSLFTQIEKNFEDSDDLFEQMDLEIRGLPPDERPKLNNQLESFRAEQKRLQREFQTSRRRFQRKQDRSVLMDGDTTLDMSASDIVTNAKQRLLENTESLERSSRKLDQGQELLAESESIGASVLNDLSHQKEVLFRSRNRLRETDDDLSTGSRVLSRMITRAQQSKVVLAIVVVAVLVAVGAGIYLSFQKS